eukprot:GHVU01170453.1.p3 GENE.GHVU01170453.1~~GHVU01170453.1.p3  ORF type:complete len:106 (+),score=7.43 GHVU01170453.1:204-521(+)
MYNNIPALGPLCQHDLSLFRKSIFPAWEDKAFKNGGGRLQLRLPQKYEKLNDLWLDLCLALIGGNQGTGRGIYIVESPTAFASAALMFAAATILLSWLGLGESPW